MEEALQDIRDWAEKYGDSACVNRLLEIMGDQMKIAEVKRLAAELWEMEDVKIRRVMLFCLVLMFMISLGFSAASATDSDDFGNLELDEDLILSNDNIMEEQKDIEMSSSKKPLWIPEVKNSLKLFPSSTNILEFEKIEELMNKDGDDVLVNQENHPFYTTIKKMIYSFGDVKEPNKLTIIKI